MWHFLRIPNVGDRVNPAVVQTVSGRPTKHVTSTKAPYLLAAGSTMARARAAAVVWGTGVMHPDIGIGSPKPSNVYAVRGPLSHAALRDGGVDVGDVPFGDPGYLAPALLGVSRSPRPTHAVGFAPHYVDRHRPLVTELLEDGDVLDLDVHEPPRVFLEKMAQCEVVVSSSLHGLIFAEALGIPSFWVRAGDDIAGEDFKFHDWFATTRNPQQHPHHLTSGDTSRSLAVRAEPRESTIDATALREAFPGERIEELQVGPAHRVVPVDRCRRRPVPVFLISFNRGAQLIRAIDGIRHLATPTDIVVHDNGSTDDTTLGILGGLRDDGVRVVDAPRITSADELDMVDRTVAAYFADWAEPARYVVSDCDVDLSIADPHAIEVFDELLNRYRDVGCVGPMLRIRDIPPGYPLFNRVMNRHIDQFWKHEPTIVETRHGPAAVLRAPIDTTFALHRAGESFKRKKPGIRVYEPFEALHLDWYETGTDTYTDTSDGTIAHWNNRTQREGHQHEPLEFTRYHVVRRTSSGTLDLETIEVSPQDGEEERGRIAGWIDRIRRR